MTTEVDELVDPSSTEAHAFEHMAMPEDGAAREKALLADVEELRREVARLLARPRPGQVFLDALSREIPWLAKEIRGTYCDPSNDDDRIGKLLVAMERRLSGGPPRDAEEWRVLHARGEVIVDIRPVKMWEREGAYGWNGHRVEATHVGTARQYYLGGCARGFYGVDPRVICAEIAGEMRLPVKAILGPGEGDLR